MPHTTISAGMSMKRPGQEQYSSDGYHLTVEMETDIENADHARAATKALFAEVRSMLEAELANGSPASGDAGRVDLWGAGGDGANGDNGKGRKAAGSDRKTTSKPASRSKGNGRGAASKGDQAGPVTNKQAKFLWQLARTSGMRTQDEVAGWLHENLGVDRGVYELTKTEASKAIDLLNNGNGGAKR